MKKSLILLTLISTFSIALPSVDNNLLNQESKNIETQKIVQAMTERSRLGITPKAKSNQKDELIYQRVVPLERVERKARNSRRGGTMRLGRLNRELREVRTARASRTQRVVHFVYAEKPLKKNIQIAGLNFNNK